MRIEDFIKELLTYNQEANITLNTSEDITTTYICEDGDGNRLNRRTTNQVFIEPTDNCPECASEYMKYDVRWCSFYDEPCRDVKNCYQFEPFYD